LYDWKDAETTLQPNVTDVRERIAKLLLHEKNFLPNPARRGVRSGE